MKKIFTTYLLSALVASLLMLLSCNKDSESNDPCANVACNNGACTDGICVCSQNYEGDNCDLLYREKFLGVWAGSAVCGSSGNSSYSITITAGNDVALVTIANIKNSGVSVFGSATTSSGIVISEQIVNGSRLTATVLLENGILTVRTYENSGDYCTFTGIRQ